VPFNKKKKKYFAALLIIGDEILSGRTQDTNTNFLANWLNEHGIQVREVRVIPDLRLEIIKSINHLRKKYDYLFTTGGIGPTHDDITAESVAKALKVKYEYNKEAYKILKDHYKKSYFNAARKKMAKMPEGASLILNPSSSAPGFFIKNVYVLPGVPIILKSMMHHLEQLIVGGQKKLSENIKIDFPESKVSKVFSNLQKKFRDLSLGSYPFFKSGKVGVSLVISGYSSKRIFDCKKQLLLKLKKIKTH